MDWQTKMNNALDYIEENLAGEIKLDIAAKFAGCSVWEFQRLFSFVAHTSLGEYIRGRKLALAANEIQTGDDKIINIGMKYGYDSPAAFSRAFGRFYGVSPSAARAAEITLKSYPKINFDPTNSHEEGAADGFVADGFVPDDGVDGVIAYDDSVVAYDGKERDDKMNSKNDMQSYGERGYYVKENAPVYFTPDLGKTCAWFRDVLGWYGDISGRSSDGTAEYGCVFDYPGELIVSGLTPFRGIHLFRGEASKGVVGFIMVQGLENFRQFVLKNGWKQISDIEAQHWGANECSVTTIDGCIIRVFETII